MIYQKYPHKIPRNPKQIEGKITIENKEKRRILEKELNLVDDLQKKLREAKNQGELYHILHLYQQNSIAIIDEKKDLKEGLEGIEDRNQKLDEISKELQTYFSIKPEYRKIDNPENLIELLIEDYENPEPGIINICGEIRTELEEVKSEMLKREKQGEETILSSKLKKYLISEISKIPKIQVDKIELIRALEPNLDFDPKKEGLV